MHNTTRTRKNSCFNEVLPCNPTMHMFSTNHCGSGQMVSPTFLDLPLMSSSVFMRLLNCLWRCLYLKLAAPEARARRLLQRLRTPGYPQRCSEWHPRYSELAAWCYPFLARWCSCPSDQSLQSQWNHRYFLRHTSRPPLHVYDSTP